MDEAKMRAIAQQEAQRLFADAAFVKHAQIEEIVESAVKKTLESFGVDTKNPIEVQENFTDLRAWSNLKRTIAESIVNTLFKSITVGFIALLIMGFYFWMSGQKPPHP